MAVDGLYWRWKDDGTVSHVRWSPDEPVNNVEKALLDAGAQDAVLAALSLPPPGPNQKARVASRIALQRGLMGGDFF